MARAVFITTVDNDKDPYDEFDEWLAFDNRHGYGTCEKLAVLACTANNLSTADNAQAIEEAIDILVRMLPDFYKKVVKDIPNRR
jgi:hypothetical protein